jgi:hypothetical protein
MKLVKFDEVFVKFKEISNPGHPHDSCKCGCPGVGGSDRKKSKEEVSKKKILFLMTEFGNCTVHVVLFYKLLPGIFFIMKR